MNKQKQKDSFIAIYQSKGKKSNNCLPYLQKLPTPRLGRKNVKLISHLPKKEGAKSIVDSMIFKFH